MTTLDKVEGISVFVKIDGQFCVAPIAAESAEAFIGMLSAFQSGSPKQTRLIRLPDGVTEHVKAAGEALYAVTRKEGNTHGS
ncbi:hypothetical protein [Acidovorax sp. Leaf78]|uniref:hypothetical protein n=1 Tax=Acidovorax sp. Leaf78 TaxID=1736237 RepID=UPI0006F6B1CD|nr:hypothetical protein [Acidovorax sp. Leaf78]KQO23463.1 hypothetical protein ASF16_04690 [Acidovorax sp. Leaf78]